MEQNGKVSLNTHLISSVSQFWVMIMNSWSKVFLHMDKIVFNQSIWATSWQNQQNDCAPSKDSDQPGQSSLCTHWVAKDPSFLHADSEDWSDWVDAQADLSLRWAHMPFCWFCHEVAQFMIKSLSWYGQNNVQPKHLSVDRSWGFNVF